MSEFNSRIIAQRSTLKVVNGFHLYNEPLFSLSEKAINRWVLANKIDSNENFVLLIKDISAKLFFLANKSQEQITEEYQELSKDIFKLIKKIEEEMANKKEAGAN